MSSFVDGHRILFFGMKTTPDAFEDPAALVENARAALREWFDHLGEVGDWEAQARLYNRLGPGHELPEPAFVRQEREAAEAREAAKREALGVLPRPLAAVAAVSPSLAAALRDPTAGRSADFFGEHGESLTAKDDPSLDTSSFEWMSADPDWDELVGSRFEAPFFPIAGADGDYVGVLVHLENPDDEAVVLYYSHEEGFSFMAESLRHWNAMCEAATTGGRRARQAVNRARGRMPKWHVDGDLPPNAYSVAFASAETILAELGRG